MMDGSDNGNGQSPVPGCWKTIGVMGEGEPSCPRLATTIHCRNCKVFSEAGRDLLERQPPADYQSEWLEILSAKKDEEPPGTLSVLIFRIESEWLALRTRLFSEVVQEQPYHRLPHRRSPVLLGLVNIHGEIQICISMSALLGIDPSPEASAKDRRVFKRMIVLCDNQDKWVFPAPEIHGIHRVWPGSLKNAPATIAKSPVAYTESLFQWKEWTVALLDDRRIMDRLKRSLS